MVPVMELPDTHDLLSGILSTAPTWLVDEIKGVPVALAFGGGAFVDDVAL